MHLFTGAVGPEFIFMDDNTRAHRALMVNEYLGSEDIQRMAWLANSPDLNPIEHAWNALERTVAMCQPPPRTILELKHALVEEWESLPQALFNSLIKSMHTICAFCLSVESDHTPYKRQHTLYKPHFYCHLLSLNSDYIGFIGNRSCQWKALSFLHNLLSRNKLYPYQISFI